MVCYSDILTYTCDIYVAKKCIPTEVISHLFSGSSPLPVMNYEITVVTGDVVFAGTNARVYIQLYGENGKSEVIRLHSRSNNYERDTTEIFKV